MSITRTKNQLKPREHLPSDVESTLLSCNRAECRLFAHYRSGFTQLAHFCNSRSY